MPKTAIKICGLTTPETLEAALAAKTDHVGFNFYAPSPRFAALDRVRMLGAQAKGRCNRVGVFVDAADAVLAETVATGALDVLQLHGSESPARAAELSARFGLPVWKVISVAGHSDLDKAGAYAEAADFILFDAKTPKGTLPGGMGLTFDWGLLAGLRIGLPWGLAGGLAPGNVGEAIRKTGAPLVDTSSGVETAPGVKDEALIAAFCNAVRAAG